MEKDALSGKEIDKLQAWHKRVPFALRALVSRVSTSLEILQP
jgi:hypothetical protein